MNHPHDPLFRWLTLIIAFTAGLVVGALFSIHTAGRTVDQLERQLAEAVQASSRMVQPNQPNVTPLHLGTLADDLAECRAKDRALQSLSAPQSNREGQTPAVTPHPYILHPGKAPLTDPTQDAYYRKLLEQGRFPVSGSAEGRPASKNDCHLPAGCMFENPVAEKVR